MHFVALVVAPCLPGTVAVGFASSSVVILGSAFPWAAEEAVVQVMV